MTTEANDLDFVTRLARDKTVAGRRVLVAAIGDLFSSRTEVLSDRERVLMGEILRYLIHEVELSVRKALAEQLAERPDAPRDLIVALANDLIEVAYPLLLKSKVLEDIELIEIIRNRTHEHQLTIGMRQSISEAVCDALVATQNVDVIKTLLNNHSAEISRTTMDYLAEQSRRVDHYQNPLLRRPELDPALAARMYGWVSEALRHHILERYDLDPPDLDDALGAVLARLKAGSGGPAGMKCAALAAQLHAEGAITTTLLLQTLWEGEVALFIAMLAAFTGVHSTLVQRILFEPGGEGLAILCKGCGIDRNGFMWIYLLSRRANSNDPSPAPSDTAKTMSVFDHIRPAAATDLVRKWRKMGELPKASRSVERLDQVGPAA